MPVDLSQLPLALPVLVASLAVHEAAHAWCADLLGDPTPSSEGRITLNPFAHLDLVGTLLFPVAAKVAGLGFVGWGRPVRITTRELGRHPRRNALVVWAAGPAINLAVAGVATICFRAAGLGLDGSLSLLVWQAIQLNVLLAVVNVIPVPPLDAGNALVGVFRPEAMSGRWLRVGGPCVLVLLLATGVLETILAPLRSALLALLLF